MLTVAGAAMVINDLASSSIFQAQQKPRNNSSFDLATKHISRCHTHNVDGVVQPGPAFPHETSRVSGVFYALSLRAFQRASSMVCIRHLLFEVLEASHEKGEKPQGPQRK